MYYTLIYPHLTHCPTVWSSTYVTNLNRIFLLQKRAVRAMTNSNHLAPSAPLFAEWNILHIFRVNSDPLILQNLCFQFLSPSFAALALSKFISD